MQQRQLRLGDILDDYCPRERRLTNHAVVAMVGDDVRQTRCTTCDAEHEYKHAKIPRQRKKGDSPAALYNQVAAGAPKRVVHEPQGDSDSDTAPHDGSVDDAVSGAVDETPIPSVMASADEDDAVPAADEPPSGVADIAPDEDLGDEQPPDDEGPIHRRLIRASLPRPEGQQPPARPIPEFTIRQPGGGRPNRFRPRHGRGGQGQHSHQFGGNGNRSNGNPGGMRGGGRPFGRTGGGGGMNRRGQGGGGRKRSK